jgi:hypothetical protein
MSHQLRARRGQHAAHAERLLARVEADIDAQGDARLPVQFSGRAHGIVVGRLVVIGVLATAAGRAAQGERSRPEKTSIDHAIPPDVLFRPSRPRASLDQR